MTQDVLISIAGSQYTEGEPEEIEMMVTGDYFEKNGRRYVIYEEALPEGTVKNTIKIMPDSLSIIKKGQVSTHMIFEKNKKNLTCYMTPYGQMMIGLNTGDVRMREGEDLLEVNVDYSLDINYEHVSDCNIRVSVRPLA